MPIVAENLLKQLGVACIALIFGTALLRKVLAETPGAGWAVFAALLLASPAAYILREAQKKKVRRQRPNQRGRERTRAVE